MADSDKNNCNRKKGWKHTAKKVARILAVLLNNLYVIPAYVVWTWLLWPIHSLSPYVYWTLEGYLCRWMFAMVASWMWSAGYEVVEVGEDLSMCTEEETLVLFNHQSTSDVPVVMTLVHNKGPVGSRMMWIMDRIFMYTQFGLASKQRGDFFIQQGKEGRDRELLRLEEHMLKVYPATRKQWIILFPEGGFLRKRLESSQRYARKNGYPVLQHVTLPRVGAMQTIMNQLFPETKDKANSHIPKGGPTLKWVIDATIAYQKDHVLDLLNVIHGGVSPCTTTIHYRVYRADLIPRDTEALTKWMYQRYAEKDQLLAEFYETGKFPVTPSECNGNTTTSDPKPVTFSLAWFVAIHTFYLASTWLQLKLLCSVWSLCVLLVSFFF